MNKFGFNSNDLSDFFSTVSSGKKERKIKKDSLIGESFDKLFWDEIKETKKDKNTTKESYVEESVKDITLKPTQPNFTEPPEVKTPDPLTPLNQDFLTIAEFNKHYKLFLNRVQQQLSTLGGGGETRLEFLDDVDRASAKTDNYFLKYNASLKKWIGDPADGVGITSIISISGVTTYYQSNADDDYIGVSANAPVTIVLPQLPTNGKKLIIKDEGNKINTYNITVQAGIGKSVENDTSVIMSNNHQSFTFFYNGTNWYIT